MTELAGYERILGEVIAVDEFTPRGGASAAGAMVASSAFFPAGRWDGTVAATPNQALRWGTQSSTTTQGGVLTVPVVPGREYTASFYVFHDSATPQYGVVFDLTAGDLFNRTGASGWGTLDSGGSWSDSGGSATDYTTVFASTGGTGKHSIGSVNVPRKSVTGSRVLDSSQVVTVATDAVASGASITVGLTSRYIDVDNYYRCVLTLNTDQTMAVTIIKRVAAVVTTVSSTTTLLTHAANTEYRMRFTTSGSSLQGRVWLASDEEPSTWDVDTTDTALPEPGGYGVWSRLTTGNTNPLPVVASYQNYLVSSILQVGVTPSTVPLSWSERVSVTFTATQPTHQIGVCGVYPTDTVIPGMVAVDDVQLEQGAAASTFTTSGASTYPVMRNYVERWPRKWSAAGFEGYTEIPCVDAFAALNAISIQTEYRQAVFTLAPAFYWPLSEPTGTEVFAEVTGNGPPLTFKASKFGPGTDPVAGQDMAIAGDPGGTGVLFTPGVVSTTMAATILGAGPLVPSNRTPVPVPESLTTPWEYTASAWVSGMTTADQKGIVTAIVSRLSSLGLVQKIQLDILTVARLWVFVSTDAASQFIVLTGTTDLTNGGLHHLACTVTQTGTSTTARLYVNGVQEASSTVNVGALAMWTIQATNIEVGGVDDTSKFYAVANGSIAHVALWYQVLTATQILDLYTAGATGYSGETSGTRVSRHLTRGGYLGETRISAGVSTMQPPSWTGTLDLLTDSQNTTIAEQGTLWVGPDGALVFEDRNDRFLRLDSVFTLGEDEAAGEYPYTEDVEFDLDPQYVFGDVQVTRSGGMTAVGGISADIVATTKRYFPRSYSATTDLETDYLAQDMADWIFNTHKGAVLRVASVTIDAGSNPTMWPLVLGVEIGQRVTVVRRAKSANQEAGLVMSADYFVEQITHEDVNMTTGMWKTTMYLSPVGVPGGITWQPWLLEDTTFGVLGSTTVLGW